MKSSLVLSIAISLSISSFIILDDASASEIGSGGSIEKGRAHDIHETITDLAVECVERSVDLPNDCSDLHPEIGKRVTEDRREDVLTLSYASRWPDDPQRILDQSVTQIRFGLPLLEGCKTALEAGTAINRTGLLCASHFGRLQFMHAMMSPEAPADYEDQRSLILAWADFAFRAGTDASFAYKDYCATIAELTNEDLRRALTFDNADAEEGSFCKPRRHPVFLWRTYPPWKVSTLFSFSCEEPVNLGTCGVVSEIVARQAAQGAIVHLIQDSYSQSHASRSPDGSTLPARGPFDPQVVCSPPRAFYVYQDQVGETDVHKPADAVPSLHENCLAEDRSIDDVVTASAKAIYFMRNSDRDAFLVFLEEAVFPPID